VNEGAAEHPFAALVRDRGGLALGRPGDLPVPVGEFTFAAVLARGEEILPPVARLAPSHAGAWLLLADDGEIGSEHAAAAQALAEALADGGAPAYLVTAGRVGGAGADSHAVEADLVAGVLDAAAAGNVHWEEDPDFGFELPVDAPGIGIAERRILVPRFLYARTDRVYDYAAMVPAVQRERAGRLERVPGVATAIRDAVAPPRRRG
jgi:phosphoenolpyruvate carboxykinase (ATP)